MWNEDTEVTQKIWPNADRSSKPAKMGWWPPHLNCLLASLQHPLTMELYREPAGIGEPSPSFPKESMEGGLKLRDRASEPGQGGYYFTEELLGAYPSLLRRMTWSFFSVHGCAPEESSAAV